MILSKKISVIFISNGEKNEILTKCIESSRNFADEIIIVGNIDNISIEYVIKIDEKKLASEGKISSLRNIGSDRSTGDIIINADADIWFPPLFSKKLEKYLRSNPNFESLNTKIIGINGSRYWDRCYHTDIGDSFMIDYDLDHPDLYYSGAFIIREKSFSKKYKWDDNLLFYQYEDVLYSKLIKKNGHTINIDKYNYVVHLDPSYKSYRNPDNYLVCDRLDNVVNEIQVKEFRELKAFLKLKSYC